MLERLIALTLTHRTAPVELREKLALNEDEIRTLLSGIRGSMVDEAMVLSTCNRTEIYAIPNAHGLSPAEFIKMLVDARRLDPEISAEIEKRFDILNSADAASHLMSVTGGVDSLVIGDQQIFGQVKDAFRLSEETHTMGAFLSKLSQAAFRAAKRIKSETTLSTGAATVSYAAVEFCRKIYDDLHVRRALVIGAGETAELAAKHLAERSIGTLRIANRSQDKARDVLDRVREGKTALADEIIGFEQLERAIANSDIIISSTAADGYIITKDLARRALKQRTSSSPLIILDIAVPRDVDPRVAELSNVFVKDIDDLRAIVEQNLERRNAELPKAEAIIEEELSQFLALQSKLEVGPTIKELRDRFEYVRREELERNKAKLSPEQALLVDDMTRRMISRLLHQPTVMLKEQNGSVEHMTTRVEMVRRLFGLDEARKDSENE